MKIDFRQITPYLKRLNTPSYNLGNLETHESKRLDYAAKEYIGEVVEDNADVLFVNGFPKNFEDLYSRLRDGGMIFFFTGGKDLVHKKILQWRIEKKHSPEILVIKESTPIWFWTKPAQLVERVVPSTTEEKTWPETPNEENHLNQALLNKYADKEMLFIETGTYLGQGIVAAHRFGFENIHSVELDKGLYDRAVGKYKDIANVWHGDSPKTIETILTNLSPSETPAEGFFWLDAHASGPLPGGASGGTPVLDELKMIKKYASSTSVIVIDDCRLFGCAEWSGVTKQEALDIIMDINPEYTISYEDGEIPQDVLVAHV